MINYRDYDGDDALNILLARLVCHFTNADANYLMRCRFWLFFILSSIIRYSQSVSRHFMMNNGRASCKMMINNFISTVRQFLYVYIRRHQATRYDHWPLATLWTDLSEVWGVGTGRLLHHQAIMNTNYCKLVKMWQPDNLPITGG